MAQRHAPRWIVMMKNLNEDWVRSLYFSEPLFSKEEAEAALVDARNSGSNVEYKLIRK